MTVMDLTPLAAAASDRLVGDDLIGGPLTITITGVKGAIMEGKEKAIFSFEGDQGKPFIPCKTMVRVMMAIWGKYANEFVGRSITVFRDPDVTFGGLATGGVRISHMSHMSEPVTVVVQAKKGKKGPIKILPLKIEQQEDPHAKWASDFIAIVNRAPDAEKLDQFVKSRTGKLDDIATARPELHADCAAAIEAKRQTFAPADDWGSAGNDWSEGPADEQRGDAHTEASLMELIEAATSREEWTAAEEAAGAATLSDDERLALSRALEAKRGELVGGGA